MTVFEPQLKGKMLRVAVPNKGILSDYAIAMLRDAGYAIRKDAKDLHLVDARNGIEFFYLTCDNNNFTLRVYRKIH